MSRPSRPHLRHSRPGDEPFTATGLNSSRKGTTGSDADGPAMDPNAAPVVLVAELDGVAVWFVALFLRVDHVLIEQLFVAPGARPQGVGPALLARAENMALAFARPEIQVPHGPADDGLRALLARAGYQLVPAGPAASPARPAWRSLI